MSKFQRVLRQIHFMVSGYRPPKRPTFLTDGELEIRRAAARDLMGDIQPKGRFGPKEASRAGPKPDYRERRPIDFDADGFPNG